MAAGTQFASAWGDVVAKVGSKIFAFLGTTSLGVKAAATREEADDLRMQLLDAVGVETAFTSFQGVGYFRLSVHLYTEQADLAKEALDRWHDGRGFGKSGQNDNEFIAANPGHQIRFGKTVPNQFRGSHQQIIALFKTKFCRFHNCTSCN